MLFTSGAVVRILIVYSSNRILIISFSRTIVSEIIWIAEIDERDEALNSFALFLYIFCGLKFGSIANNLFFKAGFSNYSCCFFAK